MMRIRFLLLAGLLVFAVAAISGCRKRAQGHSVTLTWQTVPSSKQFEIVGYNLYRRSGPGVPYVRIATGVPGPPYEDRIVQSDTVYTYAITAVDRNGRESAFSTIAAAKVH